MSKHEELRAVIRMILCDEFTGIGEEKVDNIQEDILKAVSKDAIADVDRGRDKWEQEDYLLYYAYVVYRLNSWKCEAAAQLSKDGHRDLALKHPCNIDGMNAITDAIRMVKPELLELSFDERLKAVEAYLFG